METAQSYRSNESGKLIYRRTTGHPIIKRLTDLMDFGIIKGIPRNYYRIESCLELSSDHSPVIFTINSKMTKDKLCILCNAKTEWPYF